MRLLVVNQKLEYSSTTTYSFELTRALRERGHEVRLCTGGGELRAMFQQEGVESYTVKFNFFSFRKLLQFLREFDPQLIHVLNLRSLPMGQKLAEKLRVPHLVTVHHVPKEVHMELHHPLLGGAVAVNEVIRESLVNAQRLSKECIRVIRSAVNLERFPAVEPALSRADRLPVIGSMGRLDPLKGYRYLIRAARILLDLGKEAMFVIVGNGPEEGALRRLVGELGLEKHVIFCPPFWNVADLIRNFDVVVVPTLRGGVGLSAVESMAMARPVVASAVGELLHLVGDGTTGLLVRQCDAEAFAEKLAHLLDHPEEARRLGEAGRKWVEENFAFAPMVDSVEEFYHEILEEAVDRGAAGAARRSVAGKLLKRSS